MNQFLSFNSKMVSVTCNPSGGFPVASYIFPTQQDLQDRKIVGISVYSAEDMTYDPNNAGQVLLTQPLFNNAFLTLYTSAVKNANNVMTQHQQPGLFYDKIPLSQLRAVQNNDTSTANRTSFSRNTFLMRPTELSFNKCKVEFPTTNIAMAAVMSAVFMFHYLDQGDDGMYWMRAMGFPQLAAPHR